MKVYHGSLNHIKNPNVEKGRKSTDFSKGFYTTANFEQAKRWALNKLRTAGDTYKAIVNVYEIDDNLLNNDAYKTLKFNGPDADWLSFVVDCRRGIAHQYDMVFGAVANDRIYATITLFESNVIDAETTIAQLKINEFFNQISFHTQAAADELSFLESIEVTEDK